jgi:hypothetical protein
MDMYAFKIQWRGKLPFIIIYRDRTKNTQRYASMVSG